MVTHLEPYLLKSEVKWALGSITANEASERREFQVEEWPEQRWS